MWERKSTFYYYYYYSEGVSNFFFGDHDDIGIVAVWCFIFVDPIGRILICCSFFLLGTHAVVIVVIIIIVVVVVVVVVFTWCIHVVVVVVFSSIGIQLGFLRGTIPSSLGRLTRMIHLDVGTCVTM